MTDPTPDSSAPDDEVQSSPGAATTPQESTVAAPASPTDTNGRTPGSEVAQAPRPRAEVALGGRQSSFDPMYRLAQNLAMSDLLPKDLKGKAANVLIVMMYGQELGLSPVQSLQGIYVVNGRPSMSGQLWFSLIRKAGHRITVSDHTDKSCTVTITRGDSGEEHAETFTWADAERAKLTGKDVWRQWPKRMLLWRAGSSCATIICPEVAMGFDLQGAEYAADVPATPSLAEVAANRERPAQPAAQAPKAQGDDPADVTDAEVVEEPSAPPAPSAHDLAAMASTHQGGSTGDLFDSADDEETGWPATRAPGSGLADGYER